MHTNLTNAIHVTSLPTSNASPTPPTISLSTAFLTERVLATAQAFIDISESGGPNRGEMVSRFLRAVGLPPGYPWCAAFIYYVGNWALYNPETRTSAWPLPATARCAMLGDFAQAHNALCTDPTRADIFLIHNEALGRFAHTGFIVDAHREGKSYRCLTIEGNTNTTGSPEGTSVCLRTRTFLVDSPDRFIRWTRLV